MIDINATLIAQILNFLILVAILRAVAYKPIVRMEAVDTGSPIKVPVGTECLGRVFNVLGKTVDHNPAPVGNKEFWPIHRPAPHFDEQETSTQILETGIKVVDLIAPYARGGKIGLFGGAGVGKTVLIMCRVGESLERNIDVRIIAACDSDLKRLTERGLFEKSLYEIVSKSVIRVPALRSRREDIPRLVDHIISELAAQHQMQPKRVLPETVQVLKDYDWPGNIKQLQGVLEYAFFNTPEDIIKPENINLMWCSPWWIRWRIPRK